MILLDGTSKTPIFEQIKEQIIFLVQKGVYKPDDRLPSIRALAGELGVNMNTVKRSFAELEESGVVYTQAGRGIFIAATALNNKTVRTQALEALEEVMQTAASKGITKREATDIAEKVFEGTACPGGVKTE